jgi:hypothetical protein
MSALHAPCTWTCSTNTHAYVMAPNMCQLLVSYHILPRIGSKSWRLVTWRALGTGAEWKVYNKRIKLSGGQGLVTRARSASYAGA